MRESKEVPQFNNSGFHDDSISSEEIKRRTNNKSQFLIKSQMTDSTNLIKNNNRSSINESEKSKSSQNINLDVYGNDNNIILVNSLENIKSSINSEDEDNIKIKKEFKNNSDGNNNELNSNLLLATDDNILFNFKNKLSKISSTEEILRDTIKISLNRTNKFNTSKLARIFTYEEMGKDEHYILKSKKFGKAKNRNIITYFLNLYIFSEFVNFPDLEKDNRFKLYFIPQTNKKFSPNNILNVLNSLKISNNHSDQFIAFINGLNELLNDREYKDIQKKNKRFKICLHISNIILFLLICGILVSAYFFRDLILDQEKIIKLSIIISAGIILLLLIIILIFQIIKFCKRNLYIEYNNLNYMLINYTRFNDYIEEWNKNFFEKNKIRVSIPISLKYLMFNLDPFQDIEIKHLDMKWFIDKAYKDKKKMANDKEFIKYYIKVRSTLVDGNNIMNNI
jgi:hypothetical protein